MSESVDSSYIFSERLKKARKSSKDFTISKLSKSSGISVNSLMAYESLKPKKHKSPNLSRAITLAECLNVSLDWLSGLTDENNVHYEKTVDSFLKILTVCNPTIELDGKYPKLVFDKSSAGNYDFVIKNFLTEYVGMQKIKNEGYLEEDMIAVLENKLKEKYSNLPDLEDYIPDTKE